MVWFFCIHNYRSLVSTFFGFCVEFSTRTVGCLILYCSLMIHELWIKCNTVCILANLRIGYFRMFQDLLTTESILSALSFRMRENNISHLNHHFTWSENSRKIWFSTKNAIPLSWFYSDISYRYNTGLSFTITEPFNSITNKEEYPNIPKRSSGIYTLMHREVMTNKQSSDRGESVCDFLISA